MSEIVQINPESGFSFPTRGLVPPISPFVMARYSNVNSNTVVIRAVVFIEEACQTEPTISVLSIDGTTMYCQVEYDYPSNEPAEYYTAWYCELSYELSATQEIDTVEVFTKNDDPKTSRGTTTAVQR